MPIKINGANTGSVTIAAPDDGDSVTFDVINDTPIVNDCINGTFYHWQRATSQSVSGIGSDDRFVNYNVSATSVTHERVSFDAGQLDVSGSPEYYSRTTIVSSSGVSEEIVKGQKILDVRKYSGKRICVSFYAKCDSSKSVSLEFIQAFGSGGSSPIYGIDPQKKSVDTNWQKLTFFVDIPSVSGKTIGDLSYSQLIIWFSGGSNSSSRNASLGNQSGTFDISEIEIYISDIERTCIRRTKQEEFKLCQAYFYISHVSGDSVLEYGSTIWATTSLNVDLIPFPVTMINTPSIAIYNSFGTSGEFEYFYSSVYNSKATTATRISRNGATLRTTVLTGQTIGYSLPCRGYIGADAEI